MTILKGKSDPLRTLPRVLQAGVAAIDVCKEASAGDVSQLPSFARIIHRCARDAPLAQKLFAFGASLLALFGLEDDL